jgi:hypothetical protein
VVIEIAPSDLDPASGGRGLSKVTKFDALHSVPLADTKHVGMYLGMLRPEAVARVLDGMRRLW